MKVGILINISKSVFLIPFGRLVRNIVFEQGITIDLDKIAIIISFPP